jgi:hypothetical protein
MMSEAPIGGRQNKGCLARPPNGRLSGYLSLTGISVGSVPDVITGLRSFGKARNSFQAR